MKKAPIEKIIKTYILRLSKDLKLPYVFVFFIVFIMLVFMMISLIIMYINLLKYE